jgi:ADP-ribosyl-[dinitrogen reductase] hydrolase
MKIEDRFRGCLLGLAVGDAVGTTVEFKPRGSFKPLTDMVGGGPFNLQTGQWTDDTSMALCLATSLVECGCFDPLDQMERYFRWINEGYLSSTGTCFDIGGTVAAALNRFQRNGEPFAGSTDPWSAGNGSIMRLAPIPMFYYPDIKAAQYYAMESSRTTHGAEECLDACRLLAGMIVRALAGESQDGVVLAEAESFAGSPKIVSLAKGDYLYKSEGEIRGSGYVVESLEAALWCFMNTSSYMDAVLTAANLGEDADTTAAVCGQLSGAYYGETGIPPSWLEKLAMGEEITDLAEKLVYKLTNSKWSVQCDS